MVSPLVALMHNQTQKLVGKGGRCHVNTRYTWRRVIGKKMKIDELHEGKTHAISDSTYKDTNSADVQTKFIH